MFPVALLCAPFVVFLSIFPPLATASPTCHSGGSSLISGRAKNSLRHNERGRQRLCSFNGEEPASVCGCASLPTNQSYSSGAPMLQQPAFKLQFHSQEGEIWEQKMEAQSPKLESSLNMASARAWTTQLRDGYLGGLAGRWGERSNSAWLSDAN